MPRILSIQDLSCLGQCSLSSAVPILSAFGFETALLPSAILSTHTGGFTDYEIFDFTDQMKKVIAHWIREKIDFEAVCTGYIAKAEQFPFILEIRNRLLVPGGMFIVDPAMADDGKLYPGLGEDIVNGMKSLVWEADVILPNLTEACLLSGHPWKDDWTVDEVKDLAIALSEMGPKLVIITGIRKGNEVGTLSYRKEGNVFHTLFQKSLPYYPGTGDAFSAVAIASILSGLDDDRVLKRSSGFVRKAIETTLDDQSHPYGVKFEEVLHQLLNEEMLDSFMDGEDEK